MEKSILEEIVKKSKLEEPLGIERIDGGFTKSSKWIISGNRSESDAEVLFAKVIDRRLASVAEQAALETEATMYGVLTDLDLTGRYFPRYNGYIKTPKQAALLIDYLPDVTFGGPWNQTNIENLHRSINAVHSTTLTPDIKIRIHQARVDLKNKLGDSVTDFGDTEKDSLFHKALQGREFINSKNSAYAASEPKGSQRLLEAAAAYDANRPASLILKDLNFGNLGIGQEGVCFVDPVYLSVGNPAFDLVVLGINILRGLPDINANKAIREIVKETFLQDKLALADLTKYWVACTSLPIYDPKDAWMDFQQSCAATALGVWGELY